MTIYLDDDYKCHTENDGTMREVETDFFDGKCKEFIEGYRYIPDGEIWTRPDGVEFTAMAAAFKEYALLETYQTIYERMLAQQADMQAALDAIYGGVTDE